MVCFRSVLRSETVVVCCGQKAGRRVLGELWGCQSLEGTKLCIQRLVFLSLKWLETGLGVAAKYC